MSRESDGSDVFEELFGDIPPASSTPESRDSLSWHPRRLTSVFVVNPSELAQLGWYHTLYHVSDLLLVGTGSTAQDAVAAISDGWADLVLIDEDTDASSGLEIEQDLLRRPVKARYLFTSDRSDQRADPDQNLRGATPFLRTQGGVNELVIDLRSAVDAMFNNKEALLQQQGLSLGSYPDPSRIEARARGTKP